jgi:hypothetical protein
MPPLILKRARIGSNVEDFDVLENGVVVYLYVARRPAGSSMDVGDGSHDGQIGRAAHGYGPTREAAMAEFAKSWRSS